MAGTAPRRAGHKQRLDHDSIVEAGLAVARVPGTTTISVRELGSQLGADPTAIYRYFRSKEDLMRALLDELLLRGLNSITADPEDWRARLRQLATVTLDHLAAHPAVGVEATVLTTHGPGEFGGIELMLDAFSRAGLEGDELVRHYALFGSHVLSGAAGIARGSDPSVPRTKTPWFDRPLVADPDRYPHIDALKKKLAALDETELYMLGVESIISSAERMAQA